ncbi:MAG: iron uptake porin [Candidatus Sericytochromatia bacterium]|nr:iron uptake porin [Candidatus Sericytochromatia bacterium]
MPSRSRLLAVLLAGALPLGPGLVPAAAAYTPVREMKDLPAEHWAFEAIQALVEKYEVMDGFADKTFRGARTITRYEAAAALAKVMAKVEELVSSATGNPVSIEPGVSSDDLRTIARLQREFRDELEVLKGKVETLDSRVGTLEKRVRMAGEVRNEYRSYLGAMPAAQSPLDDVRVRNRLNLEAALGDDLAARTSLVWDVYGPAVPGAAFGAAGQADARLEAYLSRAHVSYTPANWSAHVGVLNPSEVLTLGSSLKNPFTSNVWREGLGGYGFVGTPGLPVGGGAGGVGILSGAGQPVWWLPGTDVGLQALDPNATQIVAPRGNYGAVAATQAGPFQLGVAYYQGGMAGRELARLDQLGLPASLPQPELALPGGRLLATLGADFGAVRAQLAAKSVGLPTDAPGVANKTITGTIDLGTDALGLSLQGVARTAYTGEFNPSQASVTLASNDVLGTGFGLGVGLNAGSVVGTRLGANGGSFQLGGRNLLGGVGALDYASYGLMLRLPGFSVLPHVTLAMQQTASAGFERTMASGLTLQTEVVLGGLPRLQLEYSSGKFTPGLDNALLNSQALVSHEQLAAQMVVPF